MKMLWKLTDNIKYEDCEVSAALAQSVILTATGLEIDPPSPPPLHAASCEMRVGQTYSSAAPAPRIRPKSTGEKREMVDMDLASFTFVLQSSCPTFPLFFCLLLVLPESGTKRQAWVLKIIAGNWARACAL